jgi:hypothetical protein
VHVKIITRQLKMAERKFYTNKMHAHCKSFFIDNFEKLDNELKNKYSLIYPEIYQSTSIFDTDLFTYVADRLNKGINSDYSVHRDNDFIDYRLNYLEKSQWKKIVESTSYIEFEYVWYYFSPIKIPIVIRELVLDKLDLLEEYYHNCVDSHIKRFYMRGCVKEKWIRADLILKNGFNKYKNKFNRFGPKTPDQVHNTILNFTEEGLYGLLNGADIYSRYYDKNGKEKDIQLIKFIFKDSPTNEPILFNSLIDDLDVTPNEYLINKELLDDYIDAINTPINTLRSRLGLPKIGEGWINETKLFYQIKEIFSEHVVVHHFKPNWLGKQHFDIYFPFLNIAIEYQGKQHYEPVEFFGGQSAYLKNIERDNRKKILAEAQKCDLIYVDPDYDLNEVCNRILNSKNYTDFKKEYGVE